MYQVTLKNLKLKMIEKNEWDGKDGKHIVRYGYTLTDEFMAKFFFTFNSDEFKKYEDKKVDVLCSLYLHEFQGSRQMRVRLDKILEAKN
jgi:hypothetical protein